MKSKKVQNPRFQNNSNKTLASLPLRLPRRTLIDVVPRLPPPTVRHAALPRWPAASAASLRPPATQVSCRSSCVSLSHRFQTHLIPFAISCFSSSIQCNGAMIALQVLGAADSRLPHSLPAVAAIVGTPTTSTRCPWQPERRSNVRSRRPWSATSGTS